MATEWIGGIPEDKQNGGPKLDLKGSYQAALPNVPGSAAFQVEPKPTPFQQFRKMMWERRAQMSPTVQGKAVQDVVKQNASPHSYKKGAIFKM